jgi:hypothetical protein
MQEVHAESPVAVVIKSSMIFAYTFGDAKRLIESGPHNTALRFSAFPDGTTHYGWEPAANDLDAPWKDRYVIHEPIERVHQQLATMIDASPAH